MLTELRLAAPLQPAGDVPDAPSSMAAVSPGFRGWAAVLLWALSWSMLSELVRIAAVAGPGRAWPC